MEISAEQLIEQEGLPFESTNEKALDDNLEEIPMQEELQPLARDADYDVFKKSSPKIVTHKKPLVVKATGFGSPRKKKRKRNHKEPSTTSAWYYLILLSIVLAYAYLPVGSYVMQVTKHMPTVGTGVFSWIGTYKSQDSSPLRYKDSAYELWSEPHNTTSQMIDYRMADAQRLARALNRVFRTHLQHNAGLDCICMHHLHLDRALPDGATIDQLRLFQLCAVYNRKMSQMYMMANPATTGGSNETVSYSQRSVSCAKDAFKTVKRRKHVFIDWIDPFSQDQFYYKFSDTQAACIQLAIEEFKGNHHCHQPET